jgi:hypothetical protein
MRLTWTGVQLIVGGVVLSTLVTVSGCGQANTSASTLPVPNVTVNPADFSTTIDNQYLPLHPGMKLIHEGTNESDATRVEVSVTAETRVIGG